jgi:D-sedoheptulose 7-phosphate isomerase
MIHDIIQSHIAAVEKVKLLEPLIVKASDACIHALKGSGKLLIFGNGGSASDAQHFAAEIVGRFVRDRKGYPAIALTTDSSIITSVGNDYSFNEIFARQIEALCRPEDICIGISTSGSSANVERGLAEAKKQGALCIGLLGRDGGTIKKHCDIPLIVHEQTTARVQECHILVIHLICELIDRELAQ